MIRFPLIFWLLFTCFDFGNPEQIFAIIGIFGFLLNFTKYSKLKIIQLLSFILMLTPLAIHLTYTPIENFNYLGFQIPLGVFITSYVLFVYKSKKNVLSHQI